MTPPLVTEGTSQGSIIDLEYQCMTGSNVAVVGKGCLGSAGDWGCLHRNFISGAFSGGLKGALFLILMSHVLLGLGMSLAGQDLLQLSSRRLCSQMEFWPCLLLQ